MTTTSLPLYDIGNELYLRTSAAIGFLEAVVVTGRYQQYGGWVYSFRQGFRQPTTPHLYGNRQSLVVNSTLYLTEDELVDKCAAFELAEANILARYNRLRQLRANYCPDNPTGTG